MSETMSKHLAHKIVLPNPYSAQRRYERRLVRALQAWPSAEALAADMKETEGVERDLSTWTRYRSGSSRPPAWLAGLLLEKSVEQTRHQIRALQQRLEAIDSGR